MFANFAYITYSCDDETWNEQPNLVLTESGNMADSNNLIYMNLKYLFLGIAIATFTVTAKAIDYVPQNTSASISLKVPGNIAKQYLKAIIRQRIKVHILTQKL